MILDRPPPRPLAVTLGDPAGIGPELVVKAWRALRSHGPAFAVVGDRDVVSAAAGVVDAPEVVRIAAVEEAPALFQSALPVLDLPLMEPVVAGKPSARHAASIIRWIETGAGLALSGAVRGLVTAPISKAPLYEAGFGFPGHTEFLAELTRGAEAAEPRGPVMMLATRDLRTALVTIHLSLKDAIAAISLQSIVRTGLVLDRALRVDFGIAAPRIALAALNPHAGEGGSLGREEVEVINPAARELRTRGVACGDAQPADTLFHEDARRRFDAMICLYHDQALIPVKTLDFWRGVNITLGLPIVRTSPDHGTGFDIAGRGLARADSLIAAILAAAEMAERREGALRRSL